MLSRAWLVSALPLLLSFSRALHAQGTGSISGTIRDSVTGAPIRDAKAAVPASGRYGRESTDSLGRYTLDGVPAGTWSVEFHCPSRTLLGRSLARRTGTVAANAVLRLDIHAPPGWCVEPDSGSRVGVFRGHYSFGFEESRFVPCPDSSAGLAKGLLPGEHVVEPSAWVNFTSTAQRQRVRWPKPLENERYPRYFVRWQGTLTGPGTYGHLGVSAFAFTADTILEVRRPEATDCR